jgi:hypothetical protein
MDIGISVFLRGVTYISMMKSETYLIFGTGGEGLFDSHTPSLASEHMSNGSGVYGALAYLGSSLSSMNKSNAFPAGAGM